MNKVKSYLSNPAQIRKALVALLSCVLLGVGAHVLPAAVGHWLEILQPLLVAYGVWQAPNAAPAPSEPAPPTPAA
jgi:hypothetical protein